MDDLVKEMQRVAAAFQAPDQVLELDIQKVINTLRSDNKVPAGSIEALDCILHNPSELSWRREIISPLPPSSEYQPRQVELEFFENLIRTVCDDGTWRLPSTGQIYKINKKDKTFTLVTDTDHELSSEWHYRNKACLAALGWRLADRRDTAAIFQAEKDGWMFVVSDFSIEEQKNPATPGKNFSSGSRGQEAIITLKSGGVVCRLGHVIGRALIKGAMPDFGTGKSVAIASQLGQSDET